MQVVTKLTHTLGFHMFVCIFIYECMCMYLFTCVFVHMCVYVCVISPNVKFTNALCLQ